MVMASLTRLLSSIVSKIIVLYGKKFLLSCKRFSLPLLFFFFFLRAFGVRPPFGEPTNPKSPPGFPILGVTTSQGFEPMTWWVRGALPSPFLPAGLRPLGNMQEYCVCERKLRFLEKQEAGCGFLVKRRN